MELYRDYVVIVRVSELRARDSSMHPKQVSNKLKTKEKSIQSNFFSVGRNMQQENNAS